MVQEVDKWTDQVKVGSRVSDWKRGPLCDTAGMFAGNCEPAE